MELNNTYPRPIIAYTMESEAIALGFEELVEDLSGSEPGRMKLQSYAGPNDTVQVLFENLGGWLFLAIAFKGFFDSLGKKIGGHVGDAIVDLAKKILKSRKSREIPNADAQFYRLVEYCRLAQERGNSVIFGVATSLDGGRERNFGIQLSAATPESVAQAILSMALLSTGSGGKLEDLLQRGAQIVGENSDMSGKIAVTDRCYTVVRLMLPNKDDGPEYILLKFDPRGKDVS